MTGGSNDALGALFAASADEYLTIAEVAVIMRCSTRKVSDLAREHGVGFNLKGQAGWRFTRTDVDALLEKHRVVATPVIERRRRHRREQRRTAS